MKRAALALVLALSACRPRTEERAAAAAAVAGPAAKRRLLLTGELDAVDSEKLSVPVTRQESLSLKWVEADGTFVQKGQKVAEFDNTAFASNLAEQKLTAAQSAADLAAQNAQNAITTAEKTFDVEKARIALEKAKVEAKSDEGVLPKRVWQQKQLDLEKQTVAFAQAKDALAAHLRAAELDVKVKRLALEKSQRDIAAAEEAIEAVILTAPRDGIVVVADHPWEGRKVDVGDNMWAGLLVVRLPDLSAMKVTALLSDVDDGQVTAGMKATAYLDAYPNVPFPGVVTDVSPVAREPSRKSWRRSFIVSIKLERTESERMIPGMSVRVEIDRP